MTTISITTAAPTGSSQSVIESNRNSVNGTRGNDNGVAGIAGHVLLTLLGLGFYGVMNLM